MLNNWFKKEKPIQGMMGFGGGATGHLVGGDSAFKVTGGTQTPIGDYLFIEFENGMPGTFTVDSGQTEEAVILLAGGGGGGGCQVGGGGGGGGLVFRTNATLTPGPYSYSVGAGGIAKIYNVLGPYQGGVGGDTTLTFPGSHPYGNVTNTAKGGGGGGGHQIGSASGGSGGGGGAPPTNGSSGTQPQQTNTGWSQWGNNGGSGRNSHWAGGGGGGADGNGSPSPTNHSGGPGGAGRGFPEIPTAFGDNGLFCGGGGGCRNSTSGSNGAGGPGGGGQGGGDESQNPMDVMHGDDKTGGGGGGRRDNSEGSGRGGTGVIIIRVPAV